MPFRLTEKMNLEKRLRRVVELMEALCKDPGKEAIEMLSNFMYALQFGVRGEHRSRADLAAADWKKLVTKDQVGAQHDVPCHSADRTLVLVAAVSLQRCMRVICLRMTLLPGAGKLWLTMYMSHAKTCNGFLGHGECVMRQLTRKVSTSTWSLQQATLLAVLHDGMVAT